MMRRRTFAEDLLKMPRYELRVLDRKVLCCLHFIPYSLKPRKIIVESFASRRRELIIVDRRLSSFIARQEHL